MSDGDQPVPRQLRSGSTSQGLLLTLLGDYWFGRRVFIPSAALVALLAEFGISEQAARAALSRVQRTGNLEGARQGRHTSYRLSEASARYTLISGRRILQFSSIDASGRQWDGRWTIVAYSLQSDQNEDRRQIRRRLRALGFAPIQDAMWLCPYPRAVQAMRTILDLGRFDVTAFENAVSVEASSLDVAASWRLDALHQRYVDLIATFDQVRESLGTDMPTPTQALVARTEAMNAWRPMPRIDPNLPPELLPVDWPADEARCRFASIYDDLGELAEQRVREVVSQFSIEAAEAVHHDSVASPR